MGHIWVVSLEFKKMFLGTPPRVRSSWWPCAVPSAPWPRSCCASRAAPSPGKPGGVIAPGRWPFRVRRWRSFSFLAKLANTYKLTRIYRVLYGLVWICGKYIEISWTITIVHGDYQARNMTGVTLWCLGRWSGSQFLAGRLRCVKNWKHHEPQASSSSSSSSTGDQHSNHQLTTGAMIPLRCVASKWPIHKNLSPRLWEWIPGSIAHESCWTSDGKLPRLTNWKDPRCEKWVDPLFRLGHGFNSYQYFDITRG